jgi:hypothetical protein
MFTALYELILYVHYRFASVFTGLLDDDANFTHH